MKVTIPVLFAYIAKIWWGCGISHILDILWSVDLISAVLFPLQINSIKNSFEFKHHLTHMPQATYCHCEPHIKYATIFSMENSTHVQSSLLVSTFPQFCGLTMSYCIYSNLMFDG